MENNLRHFRFQAAQWFPLSLDNFLSRKVYNTKEAEVLEEIILAGVGGIGSYLGYNLGRLLTNETELIVYDPDILEDVNLAGQHYAHNQTGQYKIDALEEILMNFCDFTNITKFIDLYDKESDVSPVMICGFDNMEARQIFYNNWKSQEDRKLFIDGRLSAEFYQVFCIYNEKSEEIYEKEWLYLESKDLMKEECSFKQTSHFASEIASQITKLLTKAFTPLDIPPPNFIEFNQNYFDYVIKYF